MDIYLKEGQANPCDNKCYHLKGTPTKKMHNGKKYRVLTYERNLNGWARFGRGLAGVLAYITIIPLIVCKARIDRLFKEAKLKKETKVVHIPHQKKIPIPFTVPDLPATTEREIGEKHDQLKQKINGISQTPVFIDELIEDPNLSAENNYKLEEWLKARDTLEFWNSLSTYLNEPTQDILSLTLDEVVRKAKKFEAWFKKSEEKLKEIKILSFAGKEMTQLPPQIGLLSALTHLDLQGNQLNELPTEITKLTHLCFVDLRHNQLKELPAVLCQLKRLEGLWLGRNQLKELPRQIGRLRALKELNLYGNHLEQLPPEIGLLQNLEKLTLGNNSSLLRVPDTMKPIIEGGKLKELYGDRFVLPAGLFDLAKNRGIQLDYPKPPEPAKPDTPKVSPETLQELMRALNVGGTGTEGGTPAAAAVSKTTQPRLKRTLSAN